MVYYCNKCRKIRIQWVIHICITRTRFKHKRKSRRQSRTKVSMCSYILPEVYAKLLELRVIKPFAHPISFLGAGYVYPASWVKDNQERLQKSYHNQSFLSSFSSFISQPIVDDCRRSLSKDREQRRQSRQLWVFVDAAKRGLSTSTIILFSKWWQFI